MGRNAIATDDLRIEMKFGAPRRIIAALAAEAKTMTDGSKKMTAKKLAEHIITAHVEKRARKLAREAAKSATTAMSSAPAKAATPRARRAHKAK